VRVELKQRFWREATASVNCTYPDLQIIGLNYTEGTRESLIVSNNTAIEIENVHQLLPGFVQQLPFRSRTLVNQKTG
jgi:hypothetical protein